MNKILVTLLLVLAKIYGVCNFKIQQHKKFIAINKISKLYQLYPLVLVTSLNIHLLQYAYYALQANEGTTTRISYTITFLMIGISMNISYCNKIWKFDRQYQMLCRFVTIFNVFNTKFLQHPDGTKLFHNTKIVGKLNKIFFVNIFGVGILLTYLVGTSCNQYGICFNVVVTFFRIYLEFIVFYDFLLIIIAFTIQINYMNKQLGTNIGNIIDSDELYILLCDLIWLFKKIDKIMSQLNALYANQFLVVLISKVYKIPNRIYFAYLYVALYVKPSAERDFGIKYHLVNGGSNVLYTAIHMHMIIWSLGLFLREIDKTRFLLGEVREMRVDERLGNTLNLFRIQLEFLDFNIAPYKLLNINYQLIHTMVAYGVNVLIILIQFQGSSS